MKSVAKPAFVVITALLLGACETTSQIDTAPALTANYQADRAAQHVDLGKTHFNAGNYGMAEKHFRTAAASTPKSGMAWLGLAAAYDQLGRFELADRAYGELLKIEGPKPSILNNQGYSYILRGDMEKAREILGRARGLAADHPLIEANWKIANAI